MQRNAGITMFEVLIAGTILSIGVLSTLILIPTTARLEQSVSTEETARMMLRKVVEDLHERGAYDAFRRHNDFGADDPEGEDTAPGPCFEVPPLEGTHPDGFVGHIEFPEHTLQNDNKDVMVDEKWEDATMGMPRDLDGDGKLSNKAILASDAVVLPVRVTLGWKSAAGEQHLQAVIILGPK